MKGLMMNNFIMAVYHVYNALNIFPRSVCILLYDEKCTHGWCRHKTTADIGCARRMSCQYLTFGITLQFRYVNTSGRGILVRI